MVGEAEQLEAVEGFLLASRERLRYDTCMFEDLRYIY